MIVLNPLAWAQEALFGPEWEFTNDQLHQVLQPGPIRGHEPQAAKRLASVVAQKCLILGCKVTPRRGKWGMASYDYRVKFTDGFWLNISFDPKCVEVQAKALSSKAWAAKEALIQDLIFNSAESIGLKPSALGAGHINISVLHAFGEVQNTHDFLRFIIDYFNHPELAHGVLRDFSLASIPITAQISQNRTQHELEQKLSQLVEMVEAGAITHIPQIAEYIEKNIYLDHPQPQQYLVHRNQSLNFSKVLQMLARRNRVSDQPLEIRAIRAQQTMKDFVLLTELFQKRLNFLKKQTTPIKVHLTDPLKMTEKQMTTRFQNYISDAGLEPKLYLDIYPLDNQIRACKNLLK